MFTETHNYQLVLSLREDFRLGLSNDTEIAVLTDYRDGLNIFCMKTCG